MLRHQTISGGHLDLDRWAVVDQCKFVGVRITATDGEIAMRRSVFESCDLSALTAQAFDDCTFINCRGPRQASHSRVDTPSRPSTSVTPYV
jgi:hypothetical protein